MAIDRVHRAEEETLWHFQSLFVPHTYHYTTDLQSTYRTYPYNLHSYILTTPILQTYHCAVRSRFASDRIFCAAMFIGGIVRFEFDCFEIFLNKRGVLNSPDRLQCWQIAHPIPKFRGCRDSLTGARKLRAPRHRATRTDSMMIKLFC